MAPLVGLEPTTYGLTDHEALSQKPKQAITKRDRRLVFGDHPATSDQKMLITKMAKLPYAATDIPNLPGKFLPTGIPLGKISNPNYQDKYLENDYVFC